MQIVEAEQRVFEVDNTAATGMGFGARNWVSAPANHPHVAGPWISQLPT